MNNKICLLVFKSLILLQFIIKGYGIRTKDKMYEKISSTSACYRRLNGTHQVGCTSKRGGSIGVIHFCDNLKDLENIISEGTSPPYIPILPTRLFHPKILQFMIDSEKVNGVILHSDNDTLNNFTHDNQCPNPQSSLKGTCSKDSIWNPWGTGMLYLDIPFPIFYVENSENIQSIKDCFNKFNNYSYSEQIYRPLCSLELRSFMYATTNTPTCIRRSDLLTSLNPTKFCDPLGDNNIWASLHPLVETINKNETRAVIDQTYIVVAAKLDTTSFFEKTVGANSPISGIVTLLSLAKFLNDTVTLEDVQKAKKNVLFFLFNGESYDYIGSQRMLYDMIHGNFPVDDVEGSDFLPPISPMNINLYIELSQLGNSNGTLYIHHLNEEQAITNFIEILRDYTTEEIQLETVPRSLPPSSLHTFKKDFPNFPGLVIADHKTAYSNNFYNSIYDDSNNIRFKYYNVSKEEESLIPKDSIQYFITNVTEILGKSIFTAITERNYTGDYKFDVVLVNELLFCYLEDSSCKVHQAIHNNTKWPKKPLNLYVGVERGENIATTVAALTLGWFTGKYAGPGNINCTKKPKNSAFSYYNMSTSIYDLNVTNCYKITMNTTKAVSPAFNISDYNWSSGMYSTWSESTWTDISARMFLKPSPSQEYLNIALGCMSLLFSFGIMYLVKMRSHIIFQSMAVSEAPTDC
ncbi:nicastrin [Diorhabda carinulata]|uniref:nicastrin n=1 Tax=Diorhabda carinulata TaxID=1163345 RepID=UPI0025A17874|nr:nicastrin [Diorhabda carinulata]